MGVIERWTIKVCRECGSNVHTDACRFTGPLTDAPGDEVEVVDASTHRGAVEAVRAHRDRWYAVNSQNPDEARPADRELWTAALGSDLPGGQ